MERQNFENSLKQAFGQAEVSPSEDVWTNIELGLENEMAAPEVYSHPENLKKVQQEFERITQTLNTLNVQWEKLAIAIDSLS